MLHTDLLPLACTVNFPILPRPTFSGMVLPQWDGPTNLTLQSGKYFTYRLTSQCDGCEHPLRFLLPRFASSLQRSLSYGVCSSFSGICLNLMVNFHIAFVQKTYVSKGKILEIVSNSHQCIWLDPFPHSLSTCSVILSRRLVAKFEANRGQEGKHMVKQKRKSIIS